MESFNTKKTLSFLLILGIAVIFTLQFGPGSRGCEAGLNTGQAASTAAVVNGTEITMNEFAQAYRNTLLQYRSQGMTEQMARQLGFHKQVLSQMVNTELLAQAAQEHGISPTNEELARMIHAIPDFHKDGKFDVGQYRDVLRQYYQKTDVEFERDLRRQLAAQKMLQTVEATAVVSEDEVKARFLKNENKAEVTFVRITPAMAAGNVGEPTAEQAKAWADAHQEEIADYYEANKFLYNQPEQVRARHILIKVGEDATAEQKAQAKERLVNTRKKIVEEGADFATLAKELSEDVGSKQSGGDLGFNTFEAWVKPFSEAAFALKPGEVSQPVETQFGFHLIKVEEKKPPQNKPLEEVRAEIAAQLWKKAEAKNAAKAMAQKALDALKAGTDLATQFPPKEKEEGAISFQQPSAPEATSTGEFNAGTEAVPRLGVAPQILQAVFARTEPGPLDEVHPLGDAFVVVNVTRRVQPSLEAFAQKKDQLQAEARQAKQYELRDSFIDALKEKAQIQLNDAAIEELLGPVQS